MSGFFQFKNIKTQIICAFKNNQLSIPWYVIHWRRKSWVVLVESSIQFIRSLGCRQGNINFLNIVWKVNNIKLILWKLECIEIKSYFPPDRKGYVGFWAEEIQSWVFQFPNQFHQSCKTNCHSFSQVRWFGLKDWSSKWEISLK